MVCSILLLIVPLPLSVPVHVCSGDKFPGAPDLKTLSQSQTLLLC